MLLVKPGETGCFGIPSNRTVVTVTDGLVIGPPVRGSTIALSKLFLLLEAPGVIGLLDTTEKADLLAAVVPAERGLIYERVAEGASFSFTKLVFEERTKSVLDS